MRKAFIGYQVYSARDDAAKDLKGTLQQIKDIGYDGVEFAGLYGHEATEVRAMLDEIGLKAISHHVPFDLMRRDIDKVVSDNKTLGCEFIAIPFLGDADRPGSAGFAATVRDMYRFGQKIADAGMKLVYHNHDFEFTTVSGIYGLDFIYEAIPADILFTEIDCCWVKYAGLDPAEYLPRYAGRAEIVHLKDFVGRKIEGRNPYALIGEKEDTAKADQEVPFEFRPVGYGCQDVQSIIESGLKGGAKWFIVEQDLSIGRTPIEAAKMSFGTVSQLL